MQDLEVRERVAQVDSLLGKIDTLADGAARSAAVETLQALLELYGEGLARILELAARCGGEPLIASLAEDELISHLLLLHDLHPVAPEARVRAALREVQPYLEARGAGAQLVEIADGVARIRLSGMAGGCASTSAAIWRMVEQALQEAAPDLTGIEAEGLPEARPASETFVPLAALAGPGR
jgi:Fe-S cluster biogenesis protein NfuA